MAMDAAFVGRVFSYPVEYQVGAEKIREFAAAIGDANPSYTDAAVARAGGHADVIAPPTFAATVASAAQDAVLFDPELGLDFSRVVHGDQRFRYRRAIVAGDRLRCTVHIDSIRTVAGNDIIGLRTEVVDAGGEPVLTALATLVSRGAA